MSSQEITNSIQSVDLAKARISRPNDVRLWEKTRNLKLEDIDCSNKWVILGHPDDEGVKLNRGRIGAEQAPGVFRKYFYALTEMKHGLLDAGDTDPEKALPLLARHRLAEEASQRILEKNQLMAIGGGHDYAYPNIKAFLNRYPSNSLVVNLDAHLDLRPQDPEPHSGTGFRRLYEEGFQYQLIEFGYHKCFASSEQLQFAAQHNILLVSYEERKSKLHEVFNKVKAAEHIFLSVDIDGFSSAIAPGASAAWPIGLLYEDVEELLALVFPKMKAMGIYELAPRLDSEDKTSKLAAQLAYKGIDANYGN